MSSRMKARRIDAFMSYSHAADEDVAPAIQAGLHRLAKPWYRLRALHVYRDKTSLAASPALWPAIERALEQSNHFLLLASPESARSEWVRKEVDWWLEHRTPETLLIIVTEGEFRWGSAPGDIDWTVTDCLPRSLGGVYPNEPLYVDLRWAQLPEQLSLQNSRFRLAILDLAAPLHDVPKDSLDGEDVRQHRRVRRLTRLTMRDWQDWP